MKKAASIFLRAEIEPRDIDLLIHWMENPNITRYLNEDPGIVPILRQLLITVPAPMLTFHFNRFGHFFLVCLPDGRPVGFVKLLGSHGDYEVVYAIGEEALWGRGLGEAALRAALSKAFEQWNAESVTARIYPDNRRSIRLVHACGFVPGREEQALLHYRISAGDYRAKTE